MIDIDGLRFDVFQGALAAGKIPHLAGSYTGDLILISRCKEGYHFGGEINGVHGGLHPHDSLATLSYGWPGAEPADWRSASESIRVAI